MVPRSHAEIVRESGGKQIYNFLIELGFRLPKATTIQNWADRDSIPSDYWNAIERGGFASLKELAAYAESRKLPASVEPVITPAESEGRPAT